MNQGRLLPLLLPLFCLASIGSRASEKRDLSADAKAWSLNHVRLEQAVLKPEPGAAWSEAWFHFDKPLVVDARGLQLNFSMKSDRSKGEDAGSVYCKLHVTKDPSRREQVSLNTCTRPSDRWYMLYVDPGWQMQNLHYTMLLPVPGAFGTPETLERFRVRVRRDQEQWVVSLSQWSREKGWVQLASQEGVKEIRPSIAKDLESQPSIKSLSFQFPGDISSISEVSIEATPAESAEPPSSEVH